MAERRTVNPGDGWIVTMSGGGTRRGEPWYPPLYIDPLTQSAYFRVDDKRQVPDLEIETAAGVVSLRLYSDPEHARSVLERHRERADQIAAIRAADFF